MDRAVFDYIYNQQPQFNKEISEGLSTSHLMEAEEYIDLVWKCAARGFPEGLRYEGFEPCTPQESYKVSPSRFGNRRGKDLARTNVYMCKYHLSLHGEQIRPIYFMLPYPDRGNMIKLTGSTFRIAPTLADKVISVCSDHVYVPLNRARLTFRNHTHHYIRDGDAMISPVVYSNLYQNPSQRRSANTALLAVNMDSSMGHYLFCKYGLKEAFKRTGAPSVVVGDMDIYQQLGHNADDYHVFESRKVAPRGVSRKLTEYRPSQIRLAVKKSEMSPGVEGLVATFFYVTDHFPDKVTVEEADDNDMWKILLGHVIFRSAQSDAKLISEIDRHIHSLDEYVDYMAIEQCQEIGLNINTIYDLFIHLLHAMPEMMASFSGDIASLYGKRLMVNRYALADIVKTIFLFFFQLRPSNGRTLTKADIEGRIPKQINPSVVTKMNYNHPEVSNVGNAGDNLVFDLTTNIVLQSSNSGGKGGKKASTAKADHSTFLHASFAEVGSINHTTRSEPIGTRHLNPFVKTDDLDTVVRDPAKIKLLDDLQNEIKRCK